MCNSEGGRGEEGWEVQEEVKEGRLLIKASWRVYGKPRGIIYIFIDILSIKCFCLGTA